jgi:hypothetical protein
MVQAAAPSSSSGPDLAALVSAFARDGYVVVSGLLSHRDVSALVAEMEGLQHALVTGRLDPGRHGGDVYTSVAPGEVAPHPHYVLDVGRLSTGVHEVFHHPVVVGLVSDCLGGAEPWEFGDEHGREFGVVYQDARPGDSTAYSRIGWHTDHQAYPNSDFFPAVAVTVHLDPTSPANGFLRVLPQSHLGGTDRMPAAFERVPGEVALYCESGDVLLHHCDLWHAAARATEDPPGGVRRHLRGSWFAGRRPAPGEAIEPFNKNAAR